MRTATVILLLLASLICLRVEILNARAGSPLPRRTTGEGAEPHSKLRYSPFAGDHFWDAHPEQDQTQRSELQAQGSAWNSLLDFGLLALAQFPLLLGLGILLICSRNRYKSTGARVFWGLMIILVLLLSSSAVYRDYSYRTHGM